MGREEMTALANDEGMRKRREAIADPLRMRIVGLLGESEGMTAKELGDRMGMNPNRLYYHLRILEGAGVVGVVDTRAVGRMVERVYKTIYTGRYVWDAKDPVNLSMTLAAQLEVSRIGAEETLFEVARRIEAGEEPPVVMWSAPTFRTSHEEAEAFSRRANELWHEFRQRKQRLVEEAGGTVPPEWKRVRFTWLLYEEVPQNTPTVQD